MKKGAKKKKDFDYIWDLIDDSIIIILVYNILELFFQVNSYIDKVFPSSIFSIAVTLFAFGLIGYKSVRQKPVLGSGETAKYGAYAGIVVGFLAAVIGIITFYMYPERIAAALQQAAQKGADVAVAQQFIKIGLYINLVLLPAINAGIGALIAWISSLIFKKSD